MLFSIGHVFALKEIGMVLLCHLIIGQFDILLFRFGLHIQDGVEVLLLLSEMKHDASRVVLKDDFLDLRPSKE